jgi:hypothetical protein
MVGKIVDPIYLPVGLELFYNLLSPLVQRFKTTTGGLGCILFIKLPECQTHQLLTILSFI